MENNNIQTKVNRIGKAGRIVSIILIVLLSMGALALVLGGIACAILPKDLVEVSLRPVVDVKVGKELMGAEWANIDKLLSEAQEKAGEEFEGAGVVRTPPSALGTPTGPSGRASWASPAPS